MKGIGALIEAIRRNWDKLCCIVSNTSQANVLLANVATEFTLGQILTHLQDAKEDAEILLVRDEGNADLIVQQIRIYDTITDVWTTTYALLDGSNYVPVGPLVYLDSSSTLNQVIGQDAIVHPTPNQSGFRILGTDGTTDYQLKVDASGNLQIDVISSALPTGAATEVTLQAVETNTTGVARTPGIIRPTGAGNVNTVAANFFSVSVANVGLANGTVLGATIKPGEVLNFSGDALNNFFTSFAYDATSTEFIIIFVS